MGIFDKLFKNSDEDDKLVMLTVIAETLSKSDGIKDEKETIWISKYISNQPNVNRERFEHIMKRANDEGNEIFNKVQNLNEEDKKEILKFMFQLALADGYFHGAEAVTIVGFATILGFDTSHMLNDIHSDFNIDKNEIIKALEDINQTYENNGLDRYSTKNLISDFKNINLN